MKQVLNQDQNALQYLPGLLGKNSPDPENAMFASFCWKWNIGKIALNYKTIL